MEDLSDADTTDEKKSTISRRQSNLIKKISSEELNESTPRHFLKGMIGPLQATQRMEKVLKYL